MDYTVPIIIGVVVIIVIWYISTLNNLKRLGLKIDESLSDIDVALEKRYDQLTKLVDCVKGYSKHEAETLTKVIELRNKNFSQMSMQEKNEVEAKLGQAYKSINVVAEQYPDLKASTNYNTLMLSVNDIEDHLQASRRLYNSNVTELNNVVVMFPSSIVANLAHVSKREYFEASSHKREDVKMNF